MGDGLNIIAFAQSFLNFAAPTRRVLELITQGSIFHGNNPALTWMAGNASTEQDVNGNLKFSKAKSTDKIDGIVGLAMAVGRMELAQQGSVYDNRGVATVGGPEVKEAPKPEPISVGEQKDYFGGDWADDD